MILDDVVMKLLTSHSFTSGTEHVGMSPGQARDHSKSVKRRDVYGESNEG